MSDSIQPANDAGPFDLESLDDEIKALLDFPAVPRARIVEGSWSCAAASYLEIAGLPG